VPTLQLKKKGETGEKEIISLAKKTRYVAGKLLP